TTAHPFTHTHSLLTTTYMLPTFSSFFFFTHPPTTEIYTLSLHDALPISVPRRFAGRPPPLRRRGPRTSRSSRRSWCRDAFRSQRSEEHTSELQSPYDLVCRLLLEKKKKNKTSAIFEMSK